MIKKTVIAALLLICSIISFSQENEDRIKASMLYYIADYISWPNSKNNNTFNVGIYGKNTSIKVELTLIARTKKLKGKSIVVKDIANTEELTSIDLLFVSNLYNVSVPEIFSSIKDKSTLLVTDGMENNLYTMINFVRSSDNNKIAFEVNKQNLILASFDYKAELLLYGGTEVDIKELYRSTQKLLEKESSNVALLQSENQQKQTEISNKNKIIENLEKSIKIANDTLLALNDTIRNQKTNIINSNNLLNQQFYEYTNVKNKFNKLSGSFKELNDNIRSQTQRLKDLDDVIGNREETILKQTQTISEKENLLIAERKIVYLVSLSCLAFLTIGLMVFRAYRLKRKYNTILELKVEERTQELKATNELLVTEIEERQKYEKELTNSERNYREIFNATNEAIFIHNASNGQIIDVNDSMLQMYGYARNELHSINFENLCAGTSPYTGAEADKYIRYALEKGNITFEWYAKKKNGELFWVEVSLKNTYIGDENKVLAVVRDVDEKKKIAIELDNYRQNLEILVKERTEDLETMNEELNATIEELNVVNDHLGAQKLEIEATLSKLKEAQQQLIQSEKLASLGIFTAGIAHEINNPVNFISSGSAALFQIIDALRQEIGTDHPSIVKRFEDFEFTRKAILTGIERTTAIISSLRNYARSSDNQFMSYNIVDCINDALILLNNNYKYHVQIKKELPNILQIECIPGRINQLFVNILSNAIQSVEKEGEIIIKAQEVDNEKAIFEIIDNGCGIEASIIDKIFDPFFTTKTVGKGTGLGLYIVHGIVEEHKGTIEVDSVLGKGTSFKITLPLNYIV